MLPTEKTLRRRLMEKSALLLSKQAESLGTSQSLPETKPTTSHSAHNPLCASLCHSADYRGIHDDTSDCTPLEERRHFFLVTHVDACRGKRERGERYA